MDLAMTRVVEDVAARYRDLPYATVARVVVSCTEQHPDQDRLFIEHAAVAALQAIWGKR